MSTKNIINFNTELERFYFSSAIKLDLGTTNIQDYQKIYMFLGLSDENYENANGNIILSESSLKNIYKNILLMKKVNINDIALVVERIDWEANTSYDYYSDNEILSNTDNSGKLVKKFYIRNKYDQVFKCLWNNVNVSDTFDVSDIIDNGYYFTINHSGGTFDIGSFITILKSDPTIYNGTFKVVNSSFGSVDIEYDRNTFSGLLDLTYNGEAKIKNAVLSVEEPMFDTGTFNEERIILSSDGYVWKYLFTIDRAAKLKFFDENWLPIPLEIDNPNPKLSRYGAGSIDVINVVNPGDGYENGINTILIDITGDGYGANAESLVINGGLSQVSITNPGKDYTWADITLRPLSGSGANAEIQYSISPIGGHGFDYSKELFAKNLVVMTSIIEDELGTLPFDFTFNQVGVIYNPFINTDELNHANTTLISRIISLNLSSGDNLFIPNEVVTQEDYNGNIFYTGKAINFDEINNILYVINTKGNLEQSFEIKGQTSSTSRIVISSANSISSQILYTPYSGNIFYIDNRLPTIKAEKDIELVKLTLNYSQ